MIFIKIFVRENFKTRTHGINPFECLRKRRLVLSLLNFIPKLIIKFNGFYYEISYFSFWFGRLFYHLPVVVSKSYIMMKLWHSIFFLPAPFIFLFITHHYLIKSTIKLTRTNTKIAISIGLVFSFSSLILTNSIFNIILWKGWGITPPRF